MLPFLLMTLHFSQIGLTDDLTFTANPPFSLKVQFLVLSQKCPYSIIHGHFQEVNIFCLKILSNLTVFITSESIKSFNTLPGPTDANWSTSPTNISLVP